MANTVYNKFIAITEWEKDLDTISDILEIEPDDRDENSMEGLFPTNGHQITKDVLEDMINKIEHKEDLYFAILSYNLKDAFAKLCVFDHGEWKKL